MWYNILYLTSGGLCKCRSAGGGSSKGGISGAVRARCLRSQFVTLKNRPPRASEDRGFLRRLLVGFALHFEVGPQHRVHSRLVTLPLGLEPFDDLRIDPQSDVLLRGPAVGHHSVSPHFSGDLRRVIVDDDILVLHRLDALPVGFRLPLSLHFPKLFRCISTDFRARHRKPSFLFVWHADMKYSVQIRLLWCKPARARNPPPQQYPT